MKASELRIGNYYDHNGLIESVNPNTILHLWESERNWIKPIPLTEEWFVKFNFSRDEMGYWCKENSIYSFVDRGDLGFMLVIADVEYKETYVKQVHHLQNLWFALQDEELVIKQQ